MGEVINLERAPAGGEELYGKFYKAGDFLPFYIPRDFMPQIDERYYRKLFGWLQDQKVPIFYSMRPVPELRAHQRISPMRAANMPVDDFVKPILVSSDDYIIDGNHRWWAHVLRGSRTIACVNVDLKFEQAITTICKFPEAYYYADGKQHQFTS